MLRIEHSVVHPLLKQTQLCALRNRMTNGQFNHVVGSRHQCDHVVKDARPLHIGAVFKVKLFRLVVVLLQRARKQPDAVICVGKGQVCQNILFLVLGKVPEDHDAVGKDKHLGKVFGIGRQSAHR